MSRVMRLAAGIAVAAFVAGPVPGVAGPVPGVAGPVPGVAGPVPGVAGPVPGVAGPEPAVARAGAVNLSRHPIPANPGWRAYVLDPRTPYAYPRAAAGAGALVGAPRPGRGATIRGGDRLVLDFGTDVGGIVEIGVQRTDGTPIALAYSEQRQYLGPQGDNQAGSLGNDDNPDGRSDTITATAPGTYRTPGIRGAQRWISVQLRGSGSVTLRFVRVRVTSARPAVSDYVGHFLSSDAGLNRVWYAGAHTFNLNSISDPAKGTPWVVVDGAKRDRLVWLGDLGLETLTAAYTTRAAPQTIRNSIEMFSCQQYSDGYIAMASDIYVTCPPVPPAVANGPPASTNQTNPLIRRGRLPEYPAWWVIAVVEAAQYYGDAGRARVLLPVLRRVIGYLQHNLDSSGLFRTSGVEPINWHPFDLAYGEDAHTNATWVGALRAAAWIERLVGSRTSGAADDRLASSIAAAMRRQLWDPGAHAFRLNSSDPMGDHGQDGNVEAVLAGVVAGADASSALRYIATHLASPFGPLTAERASDPFMSQYVSPYISSWHLLALLRRHDGSAALALLRRPFQYMADTDPTGTMWEKLTATGQPASYLPNQLGNSLIPPSTALAGAGGTPLAHGWSTGPVAALSGYVLGLRPLSPGWARWIVEPQTLGLRFAQGQVGTPFGPLASRWRAGPASFVLTVIGPPRTAGVVAVPLGGAMDRVIARDGRIVRRGGRAVGGVGAWRGGVGAWRGGDEVRFAAGPGAHTYAWAG